MALSFFHAAGHKFVRQQLCDCSHVHSEPVAAALLQGSEGKRRAFLPGGLNSKRLAKLPDPAPRVRPALPMTSNDQRLFETPVPASVRLEAERCRFLRA
jgi:hypothetical protein